MSVVAWDGRTLAADRALSCGDTVTEGKKILRLDDGTVLAWVGVQQHGLVLAQWYQNGAKPEEWPEFQGEDSFTQLIVGLPGKGVVFFESTPVPQEVHSRYAAWGSGSDLALGALFTGAASITAVRAAIRHSSSCGFGVNWQHCHRSVVASMTYSFEQLYQLIRRFHRFGQTRPVEIGLVSAATEGNVVAAIERKERQFIEMQTKMNVAMRKAGLLAKRREFDDYDYLPAQPMRLPAWMTNTTREVSYV